MSRDPLRTFHELERFCESINVDSRSFLKAIQDLGPLSCLYYDLESDTIIVQIKDGSKYKFQRRDYEIHQNN